MISLDESRISLILATERIALVVRYLLCFAMIGLCYLGYLPRISWGCGGITFIVLAHNVFAHRVFFTQRYDLFLGVGNFFAYFVEICLVVWFTGADTSEAYVLYYLLLIGFSAYSPRFTKIMLVAALCCLAFAGIVLIKELHSGINAPLGVLGAKSVGILVCGWLVGSLSRLLGRTEENSFARAQELISSEATLRTILDSAADPIVVYDGNEFITEANDRACEFLGTPRDLLVGQRIRVFLFDDGTWPAKMADLRTRGQYRGEQILLNAEGEERTVDIVVRSFIRDQERYFVAVARDITEQKDLQEAARLANVNLERLNRELRQVNELRARFIGTISQKLRSPLTALLGYIEMLLDEELGEVTPEQRKALQTCRRGALQVFRLIDDTLGLDTRQTARAHAGETAPDTPPEQDPTEAEPS